MTLRYYISALRVPFIDMFKFNFSFFSEYGDFSKSTIRPTFALIQDSLPIRETNREPRFGVKVRAPLLIIGFLTA